MARSALWFATAYTIVILVHEGAHAVTAAAYGLETTLFHFWVNIDSSHVSTAAQRAAFGSAGPLSSLLVGLLASFAYGRAQTTGSAVPLLWLAACGVSNFTGNVMSTAFIGDFSNVAGWIGLPMVVRYAISLAGGVATASVLFVAGRELRRWMDPHWSRLAVMLKGVVLPVAVGTALVILINQPVAIPNFAAARAGEAAVWMFAVAGAVLAPPARSFDGTAIRWPDLAIAIVVVVVVRLLVPGIALR